MTTEKPIAIKFDTTLWKEFGELVEKLKRAGLVNRDESRSSIIKDFVSLFLVCETARMKELLKDMTYYERQEKELEKIRWKD